MDFDAWHSSSRLEKPRRPPSCSRSCGQPAKMVHTWPEQQWVRMTRLLLGVRPPVRRGGASLGGAALRRWQQQLKATAHHALPSPRPPPASMVADTPSQYSAVAERMPYGSNYCECPCRCRRWTRHKVSCNYCGCMVGTTCCLATSEDIVDRRCHLCVDEEWRKGVRTRLVKVFRSCGCSAVAVVSCLSSAVHNYCPQLRPC